MHRFPRLPVLASGLVALVLFTTACAKSEPSDVSIGTLDTASSTSSAPVATTAPTSGSTTTETSGAQPDGFPTPPDPAPLAFASCGRRVECAKLTVPLDYANPTNGETIELNVKRRKATKKSVGPLLVNPGGPGAAGSTMADNAAGYFSPDLLDNFDIIAWDPRGTGQSAPVKCTDNIDNLYGLDLSPDDDAERATLKAADDAFAAGCRERSGRLLPFISTQDSARDIDMIRRALGSEQISYFGFSYGSELGATYATIFPNRVRAMVIDGAVDPTANYLESAVQQNIGFEKSLTAFLTDCASRTRCAFNRGTDTENAFVELMKKIDAAPLVVRGKTDRPPVNQGVAYFGVATALYYEALWDQLAKALDEADNGNGAGLLDLYDQYTEHDNPDAKHFFDSFITISCADDIGPTSLEDIRALNAEIARAAPRLGALASSEENTCAKLGFTPKPPVTITGKGAGPILVVGTTGDPATPFAGTKVMAESLEEGLLLTVVANQHTGYSANECAQETIDAALIKEKMPEAGTTCE